MSITYLASHNNTKYTKVAVEITSFKVLLLFMDLLHLISEFLSPSFTQVGLSAPQTPTSQSKMVVVHMNITKTVKTCTMHYLPLLHSCDQASFLNLRVTSLPPPTSAFRVNWDKAENSSALAPSN